MNDRTFMLRVPKAKKLLESLGIDVVDVSTPAIHLTRTGPMRPYPESVTRSLEDALMEESESRGDG